ncbi:ribonuclease III domain-containing protein [Cubamyces lactineus]|nr:ribonuclease III domain-containing protein [Cubamyces lactineus]
MASYSTLQQSIREAISRPDFDAALPPLSDQTWMRILNFSSQTHAENERLEFLGDALMYATIGRQLYAQIPNGSPHLYTCVRAALHSNKTFAMLAEKLDIMAVSSTVLKALTRKTFGEGTAAPHKSRPQIKATADLFETVIGAYYLDHGFEALYEWVKEIYTPLINAAVHTFHTGKTHPAKKGSYQDLRTSKADGKQGAKQFAPAPSKERLLLSPVQQRKHALQKIQAAHAARHSPSRKISIIGSPNLPAKPMLVPAALPAKLSAAASSSKVPVQAAPVTKKAPIFIDLTLESDPEDEREQPTIFRHPLVTPRITRPSPAVSKRNTPVRASALAAVAIPAVDTGAESNSEWEDETMLENMLTAEDSFSDMDCGTSDVETPPRPSNLAQFLTRNGLDGSLLDTERPPLPRRSLFLMR